MLSWNYLGLYYDRMSIINLRPIHCNISTLLDSGNSIAESIALNLVTLILQGL